MSISWTSINNQALAKLGANSITSIDDDTTGNAIKCRAIYENVRDSLLRTYVWNCAIERAELALLSSTPEFGYSYQYTLPTAPYCLRVLEMDGGYEFKVEGRKLLTDQETCKIRYIKRITNPTELDALFVRVIVCDLASQLAVSITQSKTLKERLDIELKTLLLEAKMADAMEGLEDEQDEATDDLWVEAGR